jgi:hypothetical protein
MKAKKAFEKVEQEMRRLDLLPAQCRAARGLLGWEEYDLADASGHDFADICDFERGNPRANLNISDRAKLTLGFRAAGVTFWRSKDGIGVRISFSRRRRARGKVPPGEMPHEADTGGGPWASPPALAAATPGGVAEAAPADETGGEA